MVGYIDLHVEISDSKKALELAKRLGYSGICNIPGEKSKTAGIYSGIILEPKPGDLVKDVRANRSFDVVFVRGNSGMNRAASECYEVDAIASPEMHEERDFTRQMNSGIDLVIAKQCAETGAAIEFNFNNVLMSHENQRARILARMAQNVILCRRARVAMLITSGAKKLGEMRDPLELRAFGESIGMNAKEAKEALSKTPGEILERGARREGPRIVTKGLEVKEPKDYKKGKKYGWY